MTQEEKAKAYDEALEKARLVLQERGNEPDGASMLSNLFPELTESEDERIRKDCIKYLDWEYQHCSTNEDKIKIEKCIDWLEKQGEQKPYGQREECSDCEFRCGDKCIGSCAMKRGEQKPVEEVKPKFKVSDWIINRTDATIMQIVNNKDFYESVEIGGQRRTDTYNYIEWDFRLWTIQDAKDGDVLACESGWTCIFKTLDNHTNTFSSYCFMDNDKWFCNIGSECHTLDKAFIKAYNREIHPATKEQCDLLFQKMKDDGYEWDAEKKELKKIEQKPVEWSEEDELRIENLIAIIEGRGYPGEVIWLKNLKNRVQPQPKQEWSEEDEKMIRALVSMCDVWATSHQFYPKENKEMEALKTWLKSLHPKKQWKPSEEQMNALKNVIDGYKSLEDKEGIKSFYEQLKAL